MTAIPAMSTNTGLEVSKGELRTLRDKRLVERLALPDALLSRTDLRELGLERRAVDAVFRALDVIVLPGYSPPSRARLRLSRATRALDIQRGACAVTSLTTLFVSSKHHERSRT